MAAYNVLRFVDSSAGVTMLLYQNASGELELKAPGADGTTLCTTTGWVFEDSTLHKIIVEYVAGTIDGVARIYSVGTDGTRTTRAVKVGDTDPGLTNPTFDRVRYYGGTEISYAKVMTGAEETASVSVTVKVSDLTGVQSEAITSTITVTGSDDAPTIDAVALLTTDADTARQFTLTATDPEDNISSTGWALSSAPAKGVATINSNGVDCSFDPNGEFDALGVNDSEDVTFGVTVSDTTGLASAEQTVTVRVTGAAAAPVAINGSTSMTEDEATEKAVDLSALCSATSAAISSYAIVSGPTNATLDLDTGTGLCGITLDTSAFQSLLTGQSTTRTFTFKCVDANGNSSNVATYTINVTGIDDSPSAGEINISLNAGQNESGGATYTDVDSGLFSGTAFEFVGSLTDVSTSATTGVGSIIWQNATGATVGSLAPGRFQFQSGSDFSTLPDGQTRTVRQAYRVRDTQGNWSATNYINVTVNGTYLQTDRPPAMTIFNIQTVAGQPVTYDLINSTTDADGDYESWQVVSQALDINGVQKGIITLESDGTYPTGRLRFSPGNDFDGILAGDSEVVTAQVLAIDEQANTSNTVNVDIEVTGTAVVSAPDAQNINLSCEYNATASGQCVATDVDGDLDENGYLKASDPAKGALTVSATGAILFDPSGAFDTLLGGNSEQVTGTYTASDDLANVSAPANITVTVTNSASVGTAPVINNRDRTCDYQSTGIQGGVANHTSDADGNIDTNSFAITTNVAEGLLNFSSDGVWTFVPNGDFDDLTSGQSRSVYFECTVDDLSGLTSAPGRVTITVQNTSVAVQSPPVVQNVSVSVDADATLTGQQLTATDADGDLNANGYATSTSFGPSTDGILTVNADGSWSYDPNGVFDSLLTGSTATRSFSYTASDDAGNVSSPATVTITINGTAAAGSEPTYPAASMAALMSKYPWAAADMSNFMQLPSAYPADKTAVQSGSWTDTATWGGTIPQAGDNVKIPYGITVTFNEARTALASGNKAYGFIETRGVLQFPSFMNVRLRCDTLWGSYSAHLKMAPGNDAIINEISIPANGNIDTAKDPLLLTRGVIWHGTVDVQGYGAGTVNEKDPFLDCPHGSHPVAGATSVTLENAPVGWNVGDITIHPQTEIADQTSATLTWEDEERPISAISGNTVHFTTPLVYDHDDLEDINFATPVKDFGDGTGAGGDRPTLAIVNMTRNIKFTSEGGDSIPVYQRPHMMFMHRTTGENFTFTDAEIVDFGRTDKNARAFTPGEMALENLTITATTNLKSRYSLHLHWVGWDPATDLMDWTNLPVVKRNAVYRSPGWAFAQHQSAGYFEDNVAWNCYCGFSSEVGTEVGWWKGNITIRARARRLNGTTGRIINTKDGRFINRHDYWATGQAYGLVSRQIHVDKSDRGWNRCYGSEGDAFSWMHRPGNNPTTGEPNWVSSTRDFGLTYVDSRNWLRDGTSMGGALAWLQWTASGEVEPDQPGIAKSQYIQATAVHRGLHVIKSGPEARHDVRIFFDDFIITGSSHGLEWQYTAHYTARRFTMSHSKRYTPNQTKRSGGFFYNNTPDMVFAYGKIGGYYEGLFTTHDTTTAQKSGSSYLPVAGAFQYVIDSILWGSQGGLADNQFDWPDFLPTRTGGDGVNGTEDKAFNTTFLNPLTGSVQTWGAPPNAYSTDTQTYNLYRTSKASSHLGFTIATQWSWASPNCEWRGIVTDAWGDRQVPPYYGPLGSLTKSNNSFDIMRRARDEMGWMLVKKGYWETSAGGQAYVEDEFWMTPRTMATPVKHTVRIYLASDVPGIQGRGTNNFFPDSWSDRQPFTFNGVKP